jgi:hypothetical protein
MVVVAVATVMTIVMAMAMATVATIITIPVIVVPPVSPVVVVVLRENTDAAGQNEYKREQCAKLLHLCMLLPSVRGQILLVGLLERDVNSITEAEVIHRWMVTAL